MKLIKLENLSKEEIQAIELIKSRHSEMKTNSSAVKGMIFIYPNYLKLKESFNALSSKYEFLAEALENLEKAKDQLDRQIQNNKKSHNKFNT